MNETLDTTGLNCPLPVLKAKKAMRNLTPGETLTVTATDPGSKEDFDAFCSVTGNKLLESSEKGSIFTFVIEKRG